MVARHDLVSRDVEVFVGVGGKLGKIVFGLVVFIFPAEPCHGDDVHDAGDGADLVAIVDGKKVGERNLVPRHDAKSGIRGALVDVKTAPDTQHDAQQEQGKRNAGDRQDAAPLVAKGGLGDKAGEGHGPLIRYFTF